LKIESLSFQNFSRILLIKPSALGDVVHTIPLLPKLRARFPDARIDWFITPENAELIRHHPALSGVVLFERRKLPGFGRSWEATAELVRLFKRLRRARYDLVIDLHGQLRSALITLATCSPVRIGFDRPIARSRSESEHHTLQNIPTRGWAGAREGSWIVYSHRIPIPTLDVHAIDRYLWLKPILGLDNGLADSRIYLSAETETAADLFLRRHGLEQFAALVPGTSWETKHWHPERFAEVGRWLQKQGLSVVILGGKGDRACCATTAMLCPGAVDYSGQTTPAELAAILKRAAICVTNDSGPMHLAVALERPLVSIFGPTNPIHSGPYGRPEAVVRTDLPCSPCNFRRLSQCPRDHACMNQVTAAMVIARIESVLTRKTHTLGEANR
jgi:lipopolysaccharide heptosyltransferase I